MQANLIPTHPPEARDTPTEPIWAVLLRLDATDLTEKVQVFLQWAEEKKV